MSCAHDGRIRTEYLNSVYSRRVIEYCVLCGKVMKRGEVTIKKEIKIPEKELPKTRGQEIKNKKLF